MEITKRHHLGRCQTGELQLEGILEGLSYGAHRVSGSSREVSDRNAGRGKSLVNEGSS
jgi:hypothetical protein